MGVPRRHCKDDAHAFLIARLVKADFAMPSGLVESIGMRGTTLAVDERFGFDFR